MEESATILAGSITFASLLAMLLMASACTIADRKHISIMASGKVGVSVVGGEMFSLAARPGDAIRSLDPSYNKVPLSTTAAMAK
jgi:hypothetical protein